MSSTRPPQSLSVASCARASLLALLAVWPGLARPQAAPALSTLVAFYGSSVTGTPVPGRDGALYGITSVFNPPVGGLVYRLEADGSAIRTIYSLQTSNGYSPAGGLMVASDTLLYGTTTRGSIEASSTSGTVFQLATSGAGFTVLHTFEPFTIITVDGVNYATNADGVGPSSELVEGSDGYLYGVTSGGGPNGTGVLFRISRDGTDFHVLHVFDAVTDEPGDNGNPELPPINADGIGPNAALLEGVDGYLYGVAPGGGTNGAGTIFRVRNDGTDFSVVYAFEALVENEDNSLTNAGGSFPLAALTDGGDGRLYGVASRGGTEGFGTVFAFDPVGGLYTVLHHFDGLTGRQPEGELLLGLDGRLYGTAAVGGADWSASQPTFGTLFSIARDGTGIAVLHSFDYEDGYRPGGRLLQMDAATFIGVAREGADCDQGSVFQFSLTGATVNGVTDCGRKRKKDSGGGGVTPALLLLLAVAAAARRLGAA